MWMVYSKDKHLCLFYSKMSTNASFVLHNVRKIVPYIHFAIPVYIYPSYELMRPTATFPEM